MHKPPPPNHCFWLLKIHLDYLLRVGTQWVSL
jgi:hypothetical protein